MFCEVRNRMNDPGEGSIHEPANITVLKYAGDGLWSYEEDAVHRTLREPGTASDDALAFARNMYWQLT